MGKRSIVDIFSVIWVIAAIVFSAAAVFRYASLKEHWSMAAMLAIHILICLVCLIAWKMRLPFLLIIPAAAFFVLNSTATYSAIHTFYPFFFWQAVFMAAGALLLTLIQLIRKESVSRIPAFLLFLLISILLICCSIWRGSWKKDRNASGEASRRIWAVPEKYDGEDCAEAGTVQSFSYQSKAYATDSRDVTRNVLVYLPYNYDEQQQYNILYLMHGTGDNERSWLEENPKNKRMLDHMIADGEIDPLIVVTPTFYVEDDCKDDLDQLTYSFKEELRNDLIPAIESRFSTYAKSTDPQELTASRDHRAFAGLSRGSVTMFHSALCGCLDYISYFGGFSGSRTGAEYFKTNLQSAEFGAYPINYLYCTSGNMDFALPGQISDYAALLDVEPRLKDGENFAFDVYPMRYHSWGNWHLALFNFLQKLPKGADTQAADGAAAAGQGESTETPAGNGAAETAPGAASTSAGAPAQPEAAVQSEAAVQPEAAAQPADTGAVLTGNTEATAEGTPELTGGQ